LQQRQQRSPVPNRLPSLNDGPRRYVARQANRRRVLLVENVRRVLVATALKLLLHAKYGPQLSEELPTLTTAKGKSAAQADQPE
jgi:hypothetical protein